MSKTPTKAGNRKSRAGAKTTSPSRQGTQKTRADAPTISLRDALSDQIAFADGIKSAVFGVEHVNCINASGIHELIDAHIERLQNILDALPLSTAHAELGVAQ